MTILLSPSSSGNANSKPVIYCELMLPGISKTPLVSFPLIESGILPFSQIHSTPCSGSKRKYSVIGLSGNLPEPTKVHFLPSAAATGIIKRSVLPDSMQSIVSLPELSAEITCFIALISFDDVMGRTLPAPAKNEQIIALWAADLDGGTVISPLSIEFLSLTMLIYLF